MIPMIIYISTLCLLVVASGSYLAVIHSIKHSSLSHVAKLILLWHSLWGAAITIVLVGIGINNLTADYFIWNFRQSPTMLWLIVDHLFAWFLIINAQTFRIMLNWHPEQQPRQTRVK